MGGPRRTCTTSRCPCRVAVCSVVHPPSAAAPAFAPSLTSNCRTTALDTATRANEVDLRDLHVAIHRCRMQRCPSAFVCGIDLDPFRDEQLRRSPLSVCIHAAFSPLRYQGVRQTQPSLMEWNPLCLWHSPQRRRRSEAARRLAIKEAKSSGLAFAIPTYPF